MAPARPVLQARCAATSKSHSTERSGRVSTAPVPIASGYGRFWWRLPASLPDALRRLLRDGELNRDGGHSPEARLGLLRRARRAHHSPDDDKRCASPCQGCHYWRVERAFRLRRLAANTHQSATRGVRRLTHPPGVLAFCGCRWATARGLVHMFLRRHTLLTH